MAAITESATTQTQGAAYNIRPDPQGVSSGRPRFKVGLLKTAATVDDGDTITVDLWEEFGILRFMGIIGKTHSTDNSVIITEAPTTKVQGTELTVTVGGSTDNKTRFFQIFGL